jgi:hypothetical protein
MKLPPRDGSDSSGKPPAAEKPGAPAAGALGARQVTPRMALGILAALLVIVAGLWFSFGRVSREAATPLLDTSTDSSIGPDTTKANGMDTSTDSGTPAANNGMDTSTGR